MDFRIHFGDWVASGLKWAENNLEWFFNLLRSIYLGLYDAIDWIFTTPPALAVIIALALLALLARGVKFGVATAVGLLFIVGVDQWTNAMDSLSLVIVSALLAIVISIPLGI